MYFLNRHDAGRRLAARLAHLRDARDVVVVGLPRGGVPVAFEVAAATHAPLDVIVVRKLGVPFQPELAMGAIGEGGVRVLNDDVVRAARLPADEIAVVEDRERAELERRVRRFRGTRERVALADKTVVVVDDGIATGSTARAACQVARAQGAARIVVAVPVAPPGWEARLRDVADELVCLESPARFSAVGELYSDFSQTSDEEVIDLLGRVECVDDEVTVVVGDVALPGHLNVPAAARGIVAFAHGSGSSRHSARNRLVAHTLQHAGLATLLFDLLTTREELDRANVFDVDLLGGRLVAATRWLRRHPSVADLPLGYFGASTGAAAALWAAAEPGADVAAVVSRGGRTDLAGSRLGLVRAPTLLIVGGDDDQVLALNREAQRHLLCEHRLAVVSGATHLFEEPGALHEVAGLACSWFTGHLHAARHASADAESSRVVTAESLDSGSAASRA